MTLHHLRLSQGTVSLTERILRTENSALALHLRNAILTGGETIDLLLSSQQLDELHDALLHQQSIAGAGQKALLNTLLQRWPHQTRAG
ncbi:MAG: hypothetical protein CMI08_04670 [Oceanospirillaceae bacterium]|uniref:hypothetical protein n=1 Tax=unclassified Thalassolituus TaxID=2624967 RepID=UPI000C42C012|nr:MULTISPECIES: hypothetical protein [unclassified Thalassolituus]MAS24195.1 hypothetical protein [Oceanospirillaceae bacterium]MAX98490.1 hypothetical protein [Oceanospirillaceae bacterium]MBL33844.1 hypothetical protein [Oceanospirillaceae bacterium]MBS54686.1 hypothetical protein [Oceanospirillaceae bacterium]|tara:strand:- start:340 stop:603 length:264 start_codon:yes stop_codon:yes gene_type:complete